MNKGTLDLTGRRVLLDEDFGIWLPNFGDPNARQDWWHSPLAVSQWGNNDWAAPISGNTVHTVVPRAPGRGPGNMLRIEAVKQGNGRWLSGMLNSVSPDGTQGTPVPAYSYVEATVQFPDADRLENIAGTIPGFWLNTIAPPGFTANAYGTLEIDIFEDSNDNPYIFQSTVHVWNADPHYARYATAVPGYRRLMEGFHTFGCDMTPEFIAFYFDGVCYFKTPRPNVPPLSHSLMIGLSIGGQGWPDPVDDGPIIMNIESVRVLL